MVKLFVYLPLFQALWALHARAHDADHVHPITAAPAESLVHQKRAGVVDCTEWSLVGGGTPACRSGRTCLFAASSSFEACLPETQTTQIILVTSCYDYPTSYNGAEPPDSTFCAASAPYCGTYLFSFNNGDIYTNLGCSDTPYRSIATEVEALATGGQTTGGAAASTGATRTSTVIRSTTTPPTTTVASTASATAPVVPVDTPATTRGAAVGTPSTESSQSTATVATQTRNAAPAGGPGAGALGGLVLLIGELTMHLL